MQAIRIKFDSKNYNWKSDQECNRMFLHITEQHINDVIRARGYIYLNQIYEELGCEWNPDDRNVCVRTKVEGKPPLVQISALYEPDGVLSAADIILYFC